MTSLKPLKELLREIGKFQLEASPSNVIRKWEVAVEDQEENMRLGASIVEACSIGIWGNIRMF